MGKADISTKDFLKISEIFAELFNESFKRLIQNRSKPEIEPVIDGISGFLCLDKNGMPTTALHWDD